MTLREFYECVIDLESSLESLDHEGAEAVRTARLGGATSSEILERVWFALLKTRDKYVDLAPRVEPLLDFIDSVLGPSPGRRTP
jgi:hypothetical protein